MSNIKSTKKLEKAADFSETLQKIRTDHNLTQKQLAKIIGVSDKTVSNWEKGVTTPDLLSLNILCKELNISATSIIEGTLTIKDRINFLNRKIVKACNFFMKNIFAIVITFGFILLLIYFMNNYDSAQIYKLKYSSDNIKIEHGYLSKTKETVILYIDNISLNKIDYAPDKVYLELYTFVEGDKTLIYKADSLDDIVIEEFNGYATALTNEILLGMKQNFYLDIKASKDKKENTYSCIINLSKSFANDKMSYTKHPSEKSFDFSYLNYMGLNISTFSLSKNLKNSYPVFNNYENIEDPIINNLVKLGYTRDDKENIYSKIDKFGGKIEFKVDFNSVVYYLKTKNNYYEIIYTTNPDIVHIKTYDNVGKLIENMKYYPDSNVIICKAGKCNDNSDKIEYVSKLYSDIMSTEKF